MKACTVSVILLFASCVPTLLAQTKNSSSTQSSTELLNRWVLKERSLAKKGNADAQEMLGEFYLYGWGVPQDSVQAAEWYRKAAERGDPGAQFMLGCLYGDGNGVPQDYKQAYFWLDLAAAHRSSLVQPFPENAPQSLKNLSRSMKTQVEANVAKARDQAASHLTQSELLRVQRNAEKWLQSHTR